MNAQTRRVRVNARDQHHLALDGMSVAIESRNVPEPTALLWFLPPRSMQLLTAISLYGPAELSLAAAAREPARQN